METTWTVIFPAGNGKVMRNIDKRQLCKWFPEFKRMLKNFGDIVEFKVETINGLLKVYKEDEVEQHGTDWEIDKAGGAFRYDGEGNLVIKPLPSKTAMARKIVRALYNLDEDVNSSHWKVKKLARKLKRDLVRDFILAEKIIADKMAQRIGKYLAQKVKK